ncbi:MAG TPA: hypothetical protein VMK66_02345 [Myxococcales bacterium]|nr:hypothetical protein [Myxococcales bacterium]
MIALIAAAHLYLFHWPGQPVKALFLLPGAGENACGIANITFGAPDGSWSGGSGGEKADCKFRQSVQPGPLLPIWVDAAKATGGADVEVAWTLQGGGAKGEGHSLTLKAEAIASETLKTSAAGLTAKATKVKDSVRVELKNGSSDPILLGDAVAARSRPEDDCLGGGPQVLLQPGETLSDTRPGLLSKSMQIWAAAFTGPKQCRWIEVVRH